MIAGGFSAGVLHTIADNDGAANINAPPDVYIHATSQHHKARAEGNQLIAHLSCSL
jgi:hypothetical protein